MAPVVDVPSSNFKRGNDGISLTKTEYHPGKHSYVKYWWSYHDRSPEKFLVVFFDVKLKVAYVAGKVRTKQYGNYKGHDKVYIDVIKGYPGKYTLRLVNVNNIDDVYAESKPFWVKEGDL
ncbi:hypothetical protein M407DRAFT_28578 [Tulasnella calospora MUT 4182]|uniref:Uncharacterized protein n=1 Tax=Tulasnella calospora MUT 4182 TaxID=1051891 RepID=A0A0C3LKM2_9AGAM|nr:hypothetical protein M407DRAFT_28578 [Tulasnella calospora MUT 4182]